MIWVDDKTGRFKKRPHFSSDELDVSCEQIVKELFVSESDMRRSFISTEKLTVLIEQHTEDFDSACDLSFEGPEVEGVTYFEKNRKPVVRISNRLQSPSFENRLRTTLTHELFHVTFHDFLYQMEEQPSLFTSNKTNPELDNVHKCKRDNIIGARISDWMEWQAGYGCGAFLMPISFLGVHVSRFKSIYNLRFQTLPASSPEGKMLIEEIGHAFQTSTDAARVRLIQKGLVIDAPISTSHRFTKM